MGHSARRWTQFDPITFVEHGRCKRCRAELVRGGSGRWTTADDAPIAA
jgi:hypothetical protein